MNLWRVYLRCPDRNSGGSKLPNTAAGTRKAPANYTASEMSRFPDVLVGRFPNP